MGWFSTIFKTAAAEGVKVAVGDMAKQAGTTVIGRRLMEASTWGSAGGALMVLTFFSENRDFLDYLADRPIVAVVLIAFILGIVIPEKKHNKNESE